MTGIFFAVATLLALALAWLPVETTIGTFLYEDMFYYLTLAEVEARACLGHFRETACSERVLRTFDDAARRSPFDATILLQAAEFARRAGRPAAAGRRRPAPAGGANERRRRLLHLRRRPLCPRLSEQRQG